MVLTSNEILGRRSEKRNEKALSIVLWKVAKIRKKKNVNPSLLYFSVWIKRQEEENIFMFDFMCNKETFERSTKNSYEWFLVGSSSSGN